MQKISLEFLKEMGACFESYEWGKTTFESDFQSSPYIDIDYVRSVLVEYSEINPEAKQWIDVLDVIKKSEKYVYFNGEQITMTDNYYVYNPITGTSTKYLNEQDAIQALVDISKMVLDVHVPKVSREIYNENGNSALVPTDFHERLNIRVN